MPHLPNSNLASIQDELPANIQECRTRLGFGHKATNKNLPNKYFPNKDLTCKVYHKKHTSPADSFSSAGGWTHSDTKFKKI